MALGEQKKAKRSYGFNMSVWANIATQLGGAIMLVIVIILSETLSGTAATSA